MWGILFKHCDCPGCGQLRGPRIAAVAETDLLQDLDRARAALAIRRAAGRVYSVVWAAVRVLAEPKR
jgi:hypothetical protein